MSMPTVFVSHGSPMLILEDVPARAFLATLGQVLPRPTAIVAVSAHWNTDGRPSRPMHRPETIHDFYGFPEALYRLHYDAAGRAGTGRAGGRADRRGASIRITGSTMAPGCRRCWAGPRPTSRSSSFRCSPTRRRPHHIALGRKLAPLREEGVLVMGSGSATHNLRRLVRGAARHASPSRGPRRSTTGWRRRWRRATRRRWRTIAARRRTPAMPIRRDEHFLPLHVAYGAAGEGARGRPLHRSFTSGNLSMASYVFRERAPLRGAS